MFKLDRITRADHGSPAQLHLLLSPALLSTAKGLDGMDGMERLVISTIVEPPLDHRCHGLAHAISIKRLTVMTMSVALRYTKGLSHRKPYQMVLLDRNDLHPEIPVLDSPVKGCRFNNAGLAT